MTRDDYYTALASAGVRFLARDGALVCSTDLAAGRASALCDLRPLAVLAMRGREARKFLQGYLTCDLSQLTSERWMIGALCNLQGRMLGTFTVTATGTGTDESVVLYMQTTTLTIVQQTLAKYAVFAKAKLRNETNDWVGIGLLGPAAEKLIASLGDFEPSRSAGTRQIARLQLASRPDNATSGEAPITGELLTHGPQRWELWLPAASATSAWTALSAELPIADYLRWQGAEIADGIGSVNGSTSGEYVPQAFNLDLIDGVSFTKGCYLGQEIVTRLQHRGETKRRLYRLAVPSAVQVGDRVLRPDERDVGRVVQVGHNTAGNLEALAVLDRADAAGPLHLPAGSVALMKLPYPLPD